MKTIKIIFALFTILFLSSVSIYSQTADSDNNSKISADKETLIWTRFDNKNNETLVSTYSLIILSKRFDAQKFLCSEESVLVTAGFFHKGKTISVAPEKIEFVIKSQMTQRARFKKEKSRKLKITADKQKLELGKMTLIRSTEEMKSSTIRGSGLNNKARITACPFFEEELAIHIPTETFKEIANSKTVKIKIGNFDIKLRKSDIKVFKNLVKRMQK